MEAEILAVDDDESIRRLLTHSLERAGFEVRVCEDGRAAADLLEAGYAPQLGVFDVMMPRLDGTRLLRQIRGGELPVDPDLPVVFLTSRGGEDDVLDGFESGANDYVTKPFRATELLARVENCLDG